MNSNDFVSSRLILSNVLVMVDDENLRKGLTIGWYQSQIQRALEELALNTFYQTLTLDLPMPKNLISPLPKNCFNIKELYLWKGDCCTVQNSVNVWWKRHYNNTPGGTGYTALAKDNQAQQQDPFFQSQNMTLGVNGIGLTPNLYYANIQNGNIMFGSSCSGYTNFRIVYNGMGVNIGDEIIIPRMLRTACEDYVVWQTFRAMRTKNPRLYSNQVEEAKDKLYNRQYGSWQDAVERISKDDGWIKTSLEEYQNYPNI